MLPTQHHHLFCIAVWALVVVGMRVVAVVDIGLEAAVGVVVRVGRTAEVTEQEVGRVSER